MDELWEIFEWEYKKAHWFDNDHGPKVDMIPITLKKREHATYTHQSENNKKGVSE